MAAFRKSIPNLLSALRLILMIPFILALARNKIAILAIVTVVIILTDYFDGFLARAWKASSDTGKMLDPLADKICTGVAALALVSYRDFPVWLLLAMVGRDLLILSGGLAIVGWRRFVPVSDLIGRFTMGIMTACLVVYLLEFELLKLPVVYITLIMMLTSLVSYGWRLIGGLSGGPKTGRG
jgi:CDP-diacylglycerol--glycerol-3-phosphate 3-phosphatidyltransferase